MYIEDNIYSSYDNTEYLFYTSFLFLLSSILCYLYNSLYSSIIIFLLFLTSINHWKKAENGIRKRIDLFMVKMTTIFYFIRSFFEDEFKRAFFYSIWLTIIIFYTLEHILDFYENTQWIIFHMAIHIYTAYSFVMILFI